MAKEFKQFLEESKQKSAMLRKQKMSKSSGPKLKVVDSDKPTSNRLGGGKRITPSNWLKKPNTPDPWKKPKPNKPSKPEKPVQKKPETKKPVQKKVVKQPTLSQRLKKAGHAFDRKMAGASNLARGAVHAGLERPRQIAHAVKRVGHSTSHTVSSVARTAGHELSGLSKHIHKTRGEFN